MQAWHSWSRGKTAHEFQTDPEQGLSSHQAAERLQRYGPNELKQEKKVPFWYKLRGQFQDFLTLILLAAGTVSYLAGERADAILIFLIILVNAVLGLLQEGRAEKALTALKEMAAPLATVIRDGNTISIPARQVVPGDLVLVEAGSMLPCDLRLSQTASLRIDESTLTGESIPVEKDAKSVLAALAPLAHRVNMAFAGTTVVYGRGQGLAVATGMHTEMGQIAKLLAGTSEEKTPLQKRLDSLGKVLGASILLICTLVFITGIIKNHQAGAMLELFLVAVSLAVAAIPEGLPAVVTIVLALGMQRMVRKNAIVKKLQAVETLGSTGVICTDKTGTLTENRMSAVALWAGGKLYKLAALEKAASDKIAKNGHQVGTERIPELGLTLMTAALCNDAAINKKGSQSKASGDPTECALLELATRGGLCPSNLRKKYPRITEIPFDSRRKIMTTVHKDDDNSYLVLTKGAPDVLVARSQYLLSQGEKTPLTPSLKREILEQNSSMAQKSYRILALAYQRLSALPPPTNLEDLEQNLTFLGLAGLMDPLRPESKPALEQCQQAGLRTIMITGDHPATAHAIGKELGLVNNQGVLTGKQIDQLTAAEFDQKVKSVNVFARVAPQHKSKIVSALQKQGEIVAVTGDGVNDAPALKQANIGVAMGIAGTDVAKSAADMILADDNFASIVRAIKEGRTIYANIRKFVYFLLSCNIGEVLIVLLAQLLGLPLPLLPIHLLWLNLLTDAFPALALGLEEAEPGIMKQPPRPPQEPLLDQKMLSGIALQSLLLTGAVLGVFAHSLSRYDLLTARTMAFTTLVLAELLRSLTSRSETLTVFQLGLLTNTALIAGIGLSGGLFLLTLYLPSLKAVFHTVSLTPAMWRLILPAAFLPAIAAEAKKLLFPFR